MSLVFINGANNDLVKGSTAVLQSAIALFPQKSDAKIQIIITSAYFIRIKYPLSGVSYHFSDVNVANFNKIHWDTV